MDHTSDKIHVMPLGDQWEIEAQSGTPLGHEVTRDGAIAMARRLAAEAGLTCVVLHDGDGVTEEIPLSPEHNPNQNP